MCGEATTNWETLVLAAMIVMCYVVRIDFLQIYMKTQQTLLKTTYDNF